MGKTGKITRRTIKVGGKGQGRYDVANFDTKITIQLRFQGSTRRYADEKVRQVEEAAANFLKVWCEVPARGIKFSR